MSFLLNPFVFAGAAGDFESIATVTVGSGGASSIEFTSIPGTYQHLQVRWVGRSTAAATEVSALGRFNSDTGNNYSQHVLIGSGSAASAFGASSQSSVIAGYLTGDNATASVFGAGCIDILDYVSTSKNTTMRSIAGADTNGGGSIRLYGGGYFNTGAITSVALTLTSGNWKQHSTAALYGIKAP